MVELTLKPWPFYGYAPGNYSIQCMICDKQKTDCDKRAIRCLECAIVASKEALDKAGLIATSQGIGCSDLARIDTPPSSSTPEVVEAVLIVKSAKLDVPLSERWSRCRHEWTVNGDGGDLGGNRTEVICRLCQCPGDFEEDHMEIVWPTT